MRKIITLLFVFCVVASTQAATAPASIAKAVFYLNQQTSTQPSAVNGKSIVQINGNGQFYSVKGTIGIVTNSAGMMSNYAPSGSSATMVLFDPNINQFIIVTFNFTSDSTGTYVANLSGNLQTGTFFALLTNEDGYAVVPRGQEIGQWVYFGPSPWVWVDGGGWAYFTPSDAGLWIVPHGFEFPIVLLEQ